MLTFWYQVKFSLFNLKNQVKNDLVLKVYF